MNRRTARSALISLPNFRLRRFRFAAVQNTLLRTNRRSQFIELFFWHSDLSTDLKQRAFLLSFVFLSQTHPCHSGSAQISRQLNRRGSSRAFALPSQMTQE